MNQKRSQRWSHLIVNLKWSMTTVWSQPADLATPTVRYPLLDMVTKIIGDALVDVQDHPLQFPLGEFLFSDAPVDTTPVRI